MYADEPKVRNKILFLLVGSSILEL